MKNTKPLKDVIAELQAMEDANPGILCIAQDEWANDAPKTQILSVYVDENSQAVIVDDFSINNTKEMAKEYNEKSLEEMWQDMNGEDNGAYTNIDEFKKDYEIIKSTSQKEWEYMQKAVKAVVITAS